MTRDRSEDENALIEQIILHGSRGYPIRKVGKSWNYSYGSIRGPRLYKTRRECLAAFEAYLNALYHRPVLEV